MRSRYVRNASPPPRLQETNTLQNRRGPAQMHYKNINLQTNGQAIAPGRHSGWRLAEVWVGHSQPAPAVSAKDTRSVLQPSAYTSSGLAETFGTQRPRHKHTKVTGASHQLPAAYGPCRQRTLESCNPSASMRGAKRLYPVVPCRMLEGGCQ